MEVTLGGIAFIPDAEKICKWRKQMEQALHTKTLTGGEASKLAGKRAGPPSA